MKECVHGEDGGGRVELNGETHNTTEGEKRELGIRSASLLLQNMHKVLKTD